MDIMPERVRMTTDVIRRHITIRVDVGDCFCEADFNYAGQDFNAHMALYLRVSLLREIRYRGMP